MNGLRGATRGSSKRPTRAQLDALIVEHGGNMTRVAEALNASRPSVYTWVYQLGLADRVGIREARPGPLPAPGDRVSATVRLPAELWRWARVTAIEWDTTVGAVVVEALEALRGLRASAATEAERKEAQS